MYDLYDIEQYLFDKDFNIHLVDLDIINDIEGHGGTRTERLSETLLLLFLGIKRSIEPRLGIQLSEVRRNLQITLAYFRESPRFQRLAAELESDE